MLDLSDEPDFEQFNQDSDGSFDLLCDPETKAKIKSNKKTDIITDQPMTPIKNYLVDKKSPQKSSPKKQNYKILLTHPLQPIELNTKTK